MIKSVNRLAFLFVVIVIFSSFAPYSDDRYTALLEGSLSILQRGHYSPPEIDDDLSQKVFALYLKKLDYFKRFLTKSDIDKLNYYKDKIDDEIKTKTFNFFNISVDIINTRVKDAESYYKEILSKPFDFTIDETFEIDPAKTAYSESQEQLKETWKLALKYETLNKLQDMIQIQDDAKKNNDTTIKIKPFDSLEANARYYVTKRYEEFFYRMSQLSRDDRFYDYLNSILNLYDPHTSYFPPKDKEDFDIRMSGSLEGIGALLSQKDEYIRVEEIIPGSPSWKQNQLKKDDIILKVAQGDDEPVDIVNMRLDHAVRLIRGKKGTVVKLTVKKPDGRIIIIPIVRDMVKIEEAFVKSLIIEDNNSPGKYGYIKLPSFYVDFNNRNGKRSASDIKEELRKLNEENVSGIILDLRDNGGGSLDEVVEIAGLFIDRGPIVQVHYNSGTTRVLEDTDGQTYYSGPLIIMVNSFSASASEILSAAMQDYKRAIIIGSPSTYGKGTVQRFDDLDNFAPPRYNQLKPLGALKYTIQKFYRINGTTTQLNGVKPDIILPDPYAHIEIGERKLDYPLPGDEIKSANYNIFNTWVNQINPIISNSNDEIARDTIFKLIDENAKRIKELRDKTLVSLNLEKFTTEQKAREKQSKRFENIGKEILNIKIFNLDQDIDKINSDSTYIARNEAWIDNAKRDIYLYEALTILEKINHKSN